MILRLKTKEFQRFTALRGFHRKAQKAKGAHSVPEVSCAFAPLREKNYNESKFAEPIHIERSGNSASGLHAIIFSHNTSARCERDGPCTEVTRAVMSFGVSPIP